MTNPVEPSQAARQIQRRLHHNIPGGAHTYAKGDDQYPFLAPPVISHGLGSRVWDSDGREFLEYGGGLRANVLGHAHPGVVDAVARAVARGTNFVRPTAAEADTAEDLLDFIDRPEWMVKFGKNGSDATSAALRLARAATGRDRVAVCRDHPFFSVDDWFIGSTSMAAGIPAATRQLTVGFSEGDLAGLAGLLVAGDVAAVFLEAAKYADPPQGWLEGVRALCDQHGTVMVLDEMITGLRWPGRTALQAYDVRPHLATFGKGLGNGISVSALAGERALMQHGGLDPDGDRVFLLSTTHGAETTGLAAARAVMSAYRDRDGGTVMARTGDRLRERLNAVSAREGVIDHLTVLGFGQNLVYATRDAEGEPSQALRALAMQEMIRGGVLGPSLVLSAAHDTVDVELTEQVWQSVCRTYAAALSDGVDGLLIGSPTRQVF